MKIGGRAGVVWYKTTVTTADRGSACVPSSVLTRAAWPQRSATIQSAQASRQRRSYLHRGVDVDVLAACRAHVRRRCRRLCVPRSATARNARRRRTRGKPAGRRPRSIFSSRLSRAMRRERSFSPARHRDHSSLWPMLQDRTQFQIAHASDRFIPLQFWMQDSSLALPTWQSVFSSHIVRLPDPE
jgi:hypothetical protein